MTNEVIVFCKLADLRQWKWKQRNFKSMWKWKQRNLNFLLFSKSCIKFLYTFKNCISIYSFPDHIEVNIWYLFLQLLLTKLHFSIFSHGSFFFVILQLEIPSLSELPRARCPCIISKSLTQAVWTQWNHNVQWSRDPEKPNHQTWTHSGNTRIKNLDRGALTKLCFVKLVLEWAGGDFEM